MKGQLAKRLANTQKSFIREILKVAQDPNVISFAGGLPNPEFFPVALLQAAANKVLAKDGANALQYAPTLGYRPLREFIAHRYAKKCNLDVDPDHILITNGSQQGLDLVGKMVLDPGDEVILESPSYLGGIQAFSLYEPSFKTVTLQDDGVDLNQLRIAASSNQAKLFYALPNFQNPSGITYSAEKRAEAARFLHQYLVNNDLDAHIQGIKTAYRRQRELMVEMLKELFPPDIKFTLPKGGMFLWVTLPEAISTMDVFTKAAERNVVFVPGTPFYVDGGGENTLRLNFSNTDETLIEEGMMRLAHALQDVI